MYNPGTGCKVEASHVQDYLLRSNLLIGSIPSYHAAPNSTAIAKAMRLFVRTPSTSSISGTARGIFSDTVIFCVCVCTHIVQIMQCCQLMLYDKSCCTDWYPRRSMSGRLTCIWGNYLQYSIIYVKSLGAKKPSMCNRTLLWQQIAAGHGPSIYSQFQKNMYAYCIYDTCMYTHNIYSPIAIFLKKPKDF